MTPEEFQEKYYLATGIEIDADTARSLLDSPSLFKSWMIRKIGKMAEPSPWAAMSGAYNEEPKPK